MCARTPKRPLHNPEVWRTAMKKLCNFLLFLLILIFVSCEIGLGSSVDTESPELTIKNPPADAVIRDAFAISGIWKDDGTIDSISVNMVPIKGGKTQKYNGTFTVNEPQRDNGTWNIVIKPEESGLIDGDYEAVVAIKDKGGHTTTMARSFTIDNTPPIMFLSRPSTKESVNGNFDSYGQTFTLEGKAADDNDVELIEVNIYDNSDCIEPLNEKPIELKRVPLTIEQDVAVFEPGKSNVYSVIYGHTDEDGIIIPPVEGKQYESVQRYCTIKIYDGAQRYPEDGSSQSEDDKKGNNTDSYYINSEAAKYFSEYKITDLYHILNETYDLGNKDTNLTEIKQQLENLSVQKSQFSLNPANNPKYVVSSRNVLKTGKTLEDIDYQLTAGNSHIEIEVVEGLDNFPIEPDTIGAYLVECNVNGDVILDNENKPASKITLFDPGTEEQNIDKVSRVLSGSAYKFKTVNQIDKKNYPGLNLDCYYRIEVVGHDIQENEKGSVISDGVYAFKLISSDSKIELSAKAVPDYISTLEEAWTGNHKDLEVSLTWKSSIEGPYDIYRKFSDTDVEKAGTVSEMTEVSGELIWSFKDKIPCSRLKEKNLPDTIHYYLKKHIDENTSSSEKLSTEAIVNVRYDSEVPHISNIQFTNAYEKIIPLSETESESIYYINNKNGKQCVVTGIATDETGIESVKLLIDDKINKSTDKARFEFNNIDFSSFTANPSSAKIIVTDVSGNQTVENLSIVFDTTPPTADHKLDAKRKDIIFRVGNNSNSEVSGQEDKDVDVGGKYFKLTYGNAETIKIRGSFTDSGSGIDLIYYKVYHSESERDTGISTILSDYKTTSDGSFALLNDSEILKKRVFYSWSSSTNYGTQNIDGKYYLDNVVSNFCTSISGFSTELNKGVNYLVLVAVDNVGNAVIDEPYSGTKYYTLNVDTEPPEITSDDESAKYSNTKSPIKLTGKVFDILSGVDEDKMEVYTTIPKVKDEIEKKKVSFTVTLTDNGSEHPVTSDPNITDDIKNQRYKKWEASIDTSKLKYDDGSIYDGTVYIYAAAKDKAGTGNSSTVSVGSIIMDTQDPEVKITPPADADKYTDGIQVNGTISLSGTAMDLKGLDEGNNTLILSYALNETGTYNVLKSIKNAGNWTFSDINVNSLKPEGAPVEATQDVWFKVSSKDLAGNVGESDTCKVTVDPHSDRPVISFSNVIVKDDMSNAADKHTWITSTQIRGLVEDDDGITEVKYSLTGNNDWSDNCYNPTNGEFVINLPSDGTMDEKHTIYFNVIEKGTGKEYITKNPSSLQEALGSPKLLAQDATDENKNVILGKSAEKINTILYVNIDLIGPAIPVLAYTMSDYSEYFDKSGSVYTKQNLDGDLIADNKPKNKTNWKDLTSSIQTGGPSETLYILMKAEDANGIQSIQLKDGLNLITGDSVREEQNGNSVTALFRIDVSNIEFVNDKSFSIVVKDKAGKTNENSFVKIVIDRKAPEVSIRNPISGSLVYGNAGVANDRVTVTGSVKDDTNDIKDIFLAVTKKNNDGTFEEPSEYTSIKTDNANAIYAVFNGNTENENNKKDECYLDLFNSYINQLYGPGTVYSDYRKDVCLWFYAVDQFGNSGAGEPVKHPLTILTQGDKPEVTITYPEIDQTLGGAITITGSTTIATDTVDKVYIQIDPELTESGFASNWYEKLGGKIAGKALSYEIVDTGIDDPGYEKGIVAKGTSQSWYVTVNMLKELESSDPENADTIAVRAFAVGKTNKKLSEFQETKFILDSGSPIFGNTESMRLVQYDANDNETASVLYQKDLWIQGKWWLTGAVEDDNKIIDLTLDEKPLITNGQIVSNEGLVTEKTGSNGKVYLLKIPVGVGGPGEVCYGPDFTITASDGRNNIPYSVKLNYDNDAPEFTSTTLKDNIANQIVQNEGMYTIAGTFNDGEGSGFKRIAFYITRNIKVENENIAYLTDIMSVQGTTNNIPANCYRVSDYNQDAGLYWKKIEGCTAQNMQIVLPSNKHIPEYVHTGSMCRINNTIYRIDSIDSASNSFMIDTAIASGEVDVDFTIAQVIDNEISETGRTTYFGDTSNKITNDDGDQMVESYSKNDSGKWTVSINSNNIKDGAISIHFIAYDKAGNATVKNYSGTVSNNRPRIAGVKFGSDVDGNNEVSESEMKEMYSGIYNKSSRNRLENVTVNGQSPNGNKIYSLAIPNDGQDISVLSGNPVLTVKGKVKILPEIVGGNNGLSFTYCVGEKDDANIIVDGSGKRIVKTMISGSHSDDIRVDSEGNAIETPIELSVKDILNASGGDGSKDFHFQIWDHTEGDEIEIGTNSNRADLSLRFDVVLNDDEPPTALIEPFYWKNSSNNSIYYETIDETSTAKGHIELEADLPTDKFDPQKSGLYDNQPKVSGIIYLEGMARDNLAVDELWLKFDGLTGNDENDNFICVAKRINGLWSAKTDLENDGLEFIPEPDKNDSTETDDNGHDYNIVYWKIAIDTAQIDGVAGTDKEIQIMAKDRGGANEDGTFGNNPLSSLVTNTSQTAITALKWGIAKEQQIQAYLDYELTNPVSHKNEPADSVIVYQDNRSPTYIVDVVPYIVSVETALGKLKPNNPSVYNRTSLGHYPVSIIKDDTTVTYEKIKISGFNLDGSKVSFIKDADGNTVETPFDATGVTIPEEAISGNVAIVFKNSGNPITVKSLNNENNNDSKGIYTGTTTKPAGDKNIYANYYNRQPNGDNNNLLTDDVVLDIWQINSKAAVPISGAVSQPVMAINPDNHDVGFAFVNGALYYSMPNGKTYSYDNFIGGFDYWTSVTMAYDSLGNSYGTAAGGDINEKKADQFRIMTSRWGYADRHAGGYNTKTNNLRLELIGQYDYMYNGTSYEGFRNFDKERIRSPSLATGSATSTSTSVYLAYYDAINDEIRFKWGNFKASKDATWGNLTSDQKTASFFGDYYGAEKTNAESGDKVLADENDYSKYRLVHNSWLAGQASRVYDTDGNTRDAQVITKNGDPVYAGQYVSIAAIPGGGTNGDDVVVAVWWDANNNQLLYSYNLAPKSIAVGQYKQEDTGWTAPVPIFSTNIGEYCKVAVIKEGSDTNTRYSVHIAGYDGVNCDIWYAYIPNFTNTANKKTCLVDSYGLIGTDLNIDVALDSSGDPIPYISYYAGSCAHPKTAHWAGITSINSTTTLNSVDNNECFTGTWEVSVLPTQSRVSVDHVNIGVWKDQNGTITWSTTDGAKPSEDNSNIGETKLDYKEVFTSGGNTGYKTGGHVWGNGSKNPILGYAITKGAGGFIETAQMK